MGKKFLTAILCIFTTISINAQISDIRNTGENGEGDFVVTTNSVLVEYKGEGGDIVIPDTITSIAAGVFYRKAVTSLVIPESVRSIGEEAFRECVLTGILTIPANVREIGSAAFYGCAFDTVNVFWQNPPKSVEEAFYKGGVKVFSVPSCTKHRYEEFWVCVYAQNYSGNYTIVERGECEISGATGNLTWSISDRQLTISGIGAMPDYKDSYDNPWSPYQSYITSVVISDGITSIGSYAFSQCSSLITASFPAAISIGDSAFWDCSNLRTLSLGTALTVDTDITFGTNVFGGNTAVEGNIDLTLGFNVNTTKVEDVTDIEAKLYKGRTFKSITKAQSSSIAKAAGVAAFCLYPNPTTGVVNIEGAASPQVRVLSL